MYNLMKMMHYQLRHDRIVWATAAMSALLGVFMANGYLNDVMGAADRQAQTLADVFAGMVYDSTFLLVLLSAILALRVGQQFSCRTIDQLVCAGHSRNAVFFSVVLNNLLFFNLAALLFPLSGTLREAGQFGWICGADTLAAMVRAALYSLLLNSAVFMLALMVSFWLRATLRTMALTTLVMFVLAIYLAYGLALGWPVDVLPFAQIRAVVVSREWWQPAALAVGAGWLLVLSTAAWWRFRRQDLR